MLAQSERRAALLAHALTGLAMRELRSACLPCIRTIPSLFEGIEDRMQWPVAKEVVVTERGESGLRRVRVVAS